MQMSSETGIQDICVLIKEIQMSSETGIQDVRVLIVRIAKINSFGAKRIDIRITRIWESFSPKILRIQKTLMANCNGSAHKVRKV